VRPDFGERANHPLTMTSTATIYRETLKTDERATHTGKLFGVRFLNVESFAFDTAASLSTDYDGGYWQFYALSNGGFYMAPDIDLPFRVACDNGFEGALSADAFGITVCLYAYSLLSFSADLTFAATCAGQYYALRSFAAEHEECTAILRACD